MIFKQRKRGGMQRDQLRGIDYYKSTTPTAIREDNTGDGAQIADSKRRDLLATGANIQVAQK